MIRVVCNCQSDLPAINEVSETLELNIRCNKCSNYMLIESYINDEHEKGFIYSLSRWEKVHKILHKERHA
jgi:hypothetical protein